MRGDRPGEAALLQVVDGARRLLQLRAVELGGGQRHRGEIVGVLSPLGFAGTFDSRDLRPASRAELLDGVGKALAAVLHQKADRRAVGAAAEAVIELLGRTHRERGVFSLWNGQQAW
jgi:hypothetical protein